MLSPVACYWKAEELLPDQQLSQESAQGAHLGRSIRHLDFGEAGLI